MLYKCKVLQTKAIFLVYTVDAKCVHIAVDKIKLL